MNQIERVDDAKFGEARARIARALAKEGLGYEDICVKMSKQAPWRWEWQPVVKAIVLRGEGK